MSDVFEDKLLNWIDANSPLGLSKRSVLLAVSGGADSVAMAHALCQLRRQGRLNCDFVIAHINHNLRGNASDADEAFVKDFANQLDIPVATKSVNITRYATKNKLSIETAGRTLRLEALGAIALENGCTLTATAHHADDQAETLIHRLMRGTGFRGLCGINPLSAIGTNMYIRPMLNVRRSEIIQYCKDNDIQWRHDESNSDLQFTRNRIRHRLLPALAGGDDIVDSLNRLAVVSQNLQRRVEQVMTGLVEELNIEIEGFCRYTFDRDKLKAASPVVFYEMIRQAVITLGAGLRGYSKSHFDTIRQMVDQDKAKSDLPSGLEIIVQDQTVYIQRKGYAPSKPDGRIMLNLEEAVTFGCWQIVTRMLDVNQTDIEEFLKTKDSNTEWFDADKIVGMPYARPRQKGDRFRPIGARFNKKVSRFLMDGQFDAEARQNAFVIADVQKILWVAPLRMCEQAKITRNTTRVLEIRIHQSKD